MLRMILRRLGGALPNILGVIVVTFLLTRALPGDPAAYFAGPAATNEAIQQVRVQLRQVAEAHQAACHFAAS